MFGREKLLKAKPRHARRKHLKNNCTTSEDKMVRLLHFILVSSYSLLSSASCSARSDFCYSHKKVPTHLLDPYEVRGFITSLLWRYRDARACAPSSLNSSNASSSASNDCTGGVKRNCPFLFKKKTVSNQVHTHAQFCTIDMMNTWSCMRPYNCIQIYTHTHMHSHAYTADTLTHKAHRCCLHVLVKSIPLRV